MKYTYSIHFPAEMVGKTDDDCEENESLKQEKGARHKRLVELDKDFLFTLHNRNLSDTFRNTVTITNSVTIPTVFIAVFSFSSYNFSSSSAFPSITSSLYAIKITLCSRNNFSQFTLYSRNNFSSQNRNNFSFSFAFRSIISSLYTTIISQVH